MESELLGHYQQFIEGPDELKISKAVHKKNPNLVSIVADFVTWYFNGDEKRTKKLFEAARSVLDCESSDAFGDGP